MGKRRWLFLPPFFYISQMKIQAKYKKPVKEAGNKYKLEIPLLTLLANESTGESRKILKKYNKKDAINHIDLENKLAQLYLEKKDSLEKELAEIHPHKDFIINALDLVPSKRETDNEKSKEEKSKIEGNECNCASCSQKKNMQLLTLGILGIIALTAVGLIYKK